MITVFNRIELFATYSMQKQSEIRDILASGGIDCFVKTINRTSSGVFGDMRARTGSIGQDMRTALEYVIYVRKDDFDRAAAAVNKKHHG
jgi:hypothetical protein